MESTLPHPRKGEPWEYSIILSIRDGEGEEIAREVVGVGAIEAGEERAFELTVEVLRPTAAEDETDPIPEAPVGNSDSTSHSPAGTDTAP